MPVTYSRVKPDDSIHEVLQSVLDEFRSDLTKVEIKIDILKAFASTNKEGQPTGPAVSHDGYPAHAKIKITSLVDRNLGVGDAVITLDGTHWNTLDSLPNGEAKKRALLDHELYHLELVKDDEDNAQSDDIGRPRLRIRRHDWQIGGFQEVAQRHGEAAYEQSQLRRMLELHQQLLLPFPRGVTSISIEPDVPSSVTFDSRVHQFLEPAISGAPEQ